MQLESSRLRRTTSEGHLAMRDTGRSVAAVIVTYVLLWGLEGAARKWLPGTDQVFYLLRDALLLFSIAWVSFIARRPARHSRWVPIFWIATLGFVILGAWSVLSETNTAVGTALGSAVWHY
jgi:hypothetical protein